MNRNWRSLSLRILPVLLVALAVAHPAFAYTCPRVEAPEIDPGVGVGGLAAAFTAVALIWETLLRRR
jgi:hypothetical protein